MGALDFPSASVSVNAQASASGAGNGYIAVIAPVHTLDDGVPRLYSSGKAALDAHGYSEGISYAALHAQKTRRPFVIVPIPIATDGVSSAVVATAAPTGTSVVTLTDNATYGCLSEVDAILTVVTGGTIGTAGIVLSLSLDGGATSKTIRLGTANTYVIPDMGVTINFAAGTMVADEYFTWTATGPMWDSTGLALARTGLAASNYNIRTWIVMGPLSASNATLVATQAQNYATSNERFVMARADTTDLSESTWALEAAAQNADYDAVNSTYGRLSLGFGRRRVACPLTKWQFMRGPSWFASLREYRRDRDIHDTTWERKLSPITFATALSTDVVHDERVDGGALAGRFTCFTSLANGSGVYIAKDVTRASDDSPLLLPNNVQVVNAACAIVQAETERIIGGSVVLNADGTIDANQAVDIEEAVNGALKRGLLQEKVAGRGPRVSSARWTASRDDDLTGSGATMTGALELNLRGVISAVTTEVRVS